MKRSLFGVIILTLIAATFAFRQTSNPAPVLAEDEISQPLVIAHQGGEGLRPSNTMAAFEHAAELGVDMLEMDIHSTQDGVLVVIHDATVDRTTDGSGAVLDFTFEELQTLDAGYHWPTLGDHPQAGEYPYRGQGITIPALEEVFQAFPDYPMTIEIKQAEPSITQPFCDLLRDYDMTDQVIVPSFHDEVTLEFREVCPEVATAGTEAEIREFYTLSFRGELEGYEPFAAAFQVPESYGGLPITTPQFVADAQSFGIEIQVWTINEVEDMERLIELGVDGIMTDYPDRLLALLGRDVAAE